MTVPNLFPTRASNLRLAVIGEAPGKDEEQAGRPFVGASGRFLAALLSRAGTSYESCFFGNISQHRPPNNDISLFSWDGPEITHGLASLTNDIATFAPNCVLLLGNTALKAAKDPFRAHPLTPNRFSFKNANWRGSLFSGLGPFDGRKCLCSYHPAYCLRDYGCTPFLMLDIEKAVREAAQPRLNLPLRNISVDLSLGALLAELRRLREQKRLVACDIEGGVSTLSCISFADSPNSAFIVPFFRKDGSRCWPLDQELRLLRATAEVLEDPEVPKVMQYGLYDSFVLHYSYGIVVRGFVQDTMFKHWELYSELAKDDDKRTKSAKRGMGLAVQASIYTDEPYYKGDRKSQDDKTFFEYCCRDSLVTYEICDKLEQIFHGPGGRGLSRTDLASMRQHYEFNCSLLPVFRYLMWRGIRYDHVLARTRRDLLARAKCEAQARLNGLTGHGFSWKSQSEILSHATALMGLKRAKIFSFDDLAANSTKAYRESAVRLRDLMHQRAPDLSVLGEIEDLCEVSLNTDSPKQFIPFLYETLKLPVQYKEDKETKELRPTADYEALIKLARFVSQTPSDTRLPLIQTAIDIRAVDTRRGMLEIGHDQDGRIRCGYNPVGSNTGRVSCSESPTGSGYNLQTIPNYTSKADAPGGLLGDRDLFLSDPGYWFFQCDLSGADGWTVAAYSAMLGDRNLLEDYLAGLKPANILALILRGMANENSSREHFTSLRKKVSKDDWDYFACKRVQHGCSYLEGGLTVSRNIFKDSEGKFYLSPAECEKLKEAFFSRYRGIRLWHDWVARRLRERPVLIAASGQVRQFFGRRDEILTKAVAFEPQANTTYATNLALLRLWTDPENRLGPVNRPILRIEPLHQVHDAVCGQFRKEDTAWATAKIKSYFDNPLKIAGQNITIPFEGGFGPSWGNLKEGTI